MKRLFRGLRGEAPRDAYDAVVVGSGVGGLVAANLLARAGLSVLLVEQHYMPGGFCSTFRRAGFTFDASTHFYPLLGNPETLTGRLLAELGIETGWIRMDPVDTFHLPDGSRFAVPADFDAYRARLDAAFPAERSALDRFFAEAREAYALGLLAYFRGRTKPRLRELAPLTVREVLDRSFRDERLKLVLTADCPHWGSPPCRTSFVFDSMLRLSYFLGNYYPAGGSQAFADELARRFEERGGEIAMSTRAERIVVEDGAARGVELEVLRGPLRGRRFRVRAGAVVANADLLQTLERLLGPEHVPAGELAAARSLRPTYPCFLTHLGLEGVPADELEAVQGYYWRHWDADRVGRDGLVCKVFVPTVYDPSVAPPGHQAVILQKVQELDWRRVEDWDAHKAAVEAFVVGHLERVLPGVGKRIVVKLSATARTAARFTLNHSGAMLGWEMSPEQLGDGRPGIRGPVADLYLVGHWTRPGGGITPVIVSALHAAAAVLGATKDGAAPAFAPREGFAHGN
jgi:phytoene desaturase